MVQLIAGQWKTPLPSGISMLGMNGVFDSAGGNGAGQISGQLRARPGPEFEAIRDTDASARMASAIADQKGAAPSATAVAPPQRGRGTARAGAPAQAASSPVSGWSWSTTAVNGVYVGTYGTNADDKVTAKLYVKFIDNGSVLGTLTGVFTFDVPPSLGAKPITYTYKLMGGPDVARAGFYSVKPLGKAAPDAYAPTQLWVEFVRSVVKGSNGQLEAIYSPDQISGWVLDSKGRRSNTFEGIRDKAWSANVDSLMAAAQADAASAASTTQAPAPAAGPGARVVRPDIVGVFNGTYTRPNEAPTRFKLTITHTNDGLAGMATIYLPTDSGTKAYTYSLAGAQVPYDPRNFELTVNDWETIPPKDFKNFRAMGFKGTFLSNLTQNTARIISVQESVPNVAANPGTKNPASKQPATNATFYVPSFEATWNAAESADTKAVIAAQIAVGDADLLAALKAHTEEMKNAQPKQLASKDLVRKSQAYWDAYRSDFIREVFDGGFAGDVDDDPAFQALFVDYVDLFSKNCAAHFRGDHESVTITTVLTTTYPGGAVTTSTTSKTVEVDSRFVEKYAEFSGVDPAPGSAQDREQTAKTMAIAGHIFHRTGPSHGASFADANAMFHLMAAHGLAGVTGMDKFFATEVKASGPTAALRQMGENLLRGATGEPSLQEAGGKIDGAAAETDKGLPPGRFSHLIDAAHAFYREPGNARLAMRFETAFDETLASKYHGVMTPEEEYYYANDFNYRLRNQIMQPRDRSTDPAWPRLHAVFEECVAEFQ
jgi:hypothetical protein